MVINPIVGVYIPIITIPIKGEMTIPNIGSLDPCTHKIEGFKPGVSCHTRIWCMYFYILEFSIDIDIV